MTAGTTCDTSVLVPALIRWHPDHAHTRSVLGRVTALGAHVLLESYSVLTRFPAPHRFAPADAADVLTLATMTVALPGDDHQDLIVELSRHGIRGGAVYDALIAATARHHDLELLTRDHRARSAYDLIGVRYTQI